VELPHFNPDDDTDPLRAPVAELRAAISEAAAILICTMPAFAHWTPSWWPESAIPRVTRAPAGG
jgi:NAD(P)H-dependent FMN reductase